MNFSFDEIGDKVNRAFHTVVKKTNKAYETAKISYNVSGVKDELKDAYAALGKKVYENSDNLCETDIENDLIIIKTLLDRLNSEKDRLSTVKDKKRCQNCGQEIERDSAYCNKCGEKID